MPELSILIPTLNRGAMFHDTVSQVLKQAFEDFELILIDQSDPPQRAANEIFLSGLNDPRIRYVHISRKGLPNARNEGLARLSPDCKVVLFLDDDVILLNPHFLEAHLAAYKDEKIGGVTGRIVERTVKANHPTTANHLSPGGRTITNLWGQERCELPTLKGANMSYRREAVQQVGGFDRNYDGSALLEDADYSTRVAKMGWKLLFEPEAELIHLSAPTGGVRVEDALRYEFYRFKSTAYFQLKHRGLQRFPLFAGTFGAIAISRMLRWREPKVISELSRAVKLAVEAWKKGPDEGIPDV
jgi:GT2 family glycosyltransferase